MLEKALDVEAELEASVGGRRAGVLKASWAAGRDGGCWIVWR